MPKIRAADWPRELLLFSPGNRALSPGFIFRKIPDFHSFSFVHGGVIAIPLSIFTALASIYFSLHTLTPPSSVLAAYLPQPKIRLADPVTCWVVFSPASKTL